MLLTITTKKTKTATDNLITRHSLKILPVDNSSHRKIFLDVPRRIYSEDPLWIAPLESQVEAVFDPRKNSFFSKGEARRWILLDDSNIPIGRIAAFFRTDKTSLGAVPTGGIGFFECVNDQVAAGLLFSAATTWLAAKGIKAVEAPINFGENDSFWGLLIEGFESPSFGMNYNPPYYQQLFERESFVKSYDQLTNIINIRKPFPERFYKIANWVIRKKGYSFEHLEIARFDQYAADFMAIYNEGWKDFDHFVPLSKETVVETFRQMKPILDPNLILFAYVNGEPVSFVLVIPDANIWFKALKGKMNLFGKLQFLYNRSTIKANRLRAIVMGTKPAYQNHGIESALFIKLGEYVLPLDQYDELELSWVGDFNEKMIKLHMAMEPYKSRKHRTYLKKI